MSISINKDELVQLLRNGEIEKFNNLRHFSEETPLDLTESDLNHMNIVGANLSRVDLSGSDLSKSEFESIDFNYSDLSSVNFSHTTIIESNFIEVILEGSLFNNACVVKSDFTEVDFNGINACGANLADADLSLAKNLMQAVYDTETIWPDDDLLPNDFEPQENVSFANFDDKDEYPEEQF